MNSSIIIGADIGGSHITTGMVDISKRIIVDDFCLRKSVNSAASASEIIKVWCMTMEELCNKAGFKPQKLGIAMPGPCNYETGVVWIKGLNKYESLYGLSIKELIAKELDLDPQNIHMKNDAPCFLQGEVLGGAAIGYSSVIGITLGTGFGTANYANHVANDAELWQMPFKESIAEYYFSTNWFIKRYYELTGNMALDVKQLADAAAGSKLIQNMFAEFGYNLGLFLEEVLSSNKSQALICGGNISNAFDLFAPSLQKQLSSKGIAIDVKRSALGEKSALIGAASGWQAHKLINTKTI
ncbi:ROK family protein [Mucilaginibacter terrae]|uniref:ROK family protein n=1 Tax=Mucilaginibacter terrae TaxID=1955052 RepID=UPI00362D2C4F